VKVKHQEPLESLVGSEREGRPIFDLWEGACEGTKLPRETNTRRGSNSEWHWEFFYGRETGARRSVVKETNRGEL